MTHHQRLGRGFACKANPTQLKELGVNDFMCSKKRGLKVEDMAKSQAVYRGLRRFRAGVEAGISLLKRSFGLDRCTSRGLAYGRVWAVGEAGAILSYTPR